MFLKRIEMFGFKSFAERTVIELSDGITALLGPNGCGKSNIVDAVKWVLGEQSPHNMRAERMEDVIFSGSGNRKALSIAEVSLIIINDNGFLEIERPEIAIKRRLYRNGESEYFLNAMPVRLKEIRELFFDTGIGKSAYSVMEQGRIDQVLSNKPEERRYLFEEAAGITKFKIRGSEAERQLLKTEKNMQQVKNILQEVLRRYDTLKKQTEKTLEYRHLRASLFEIDRDLKLLQWRHIAEKKQKKIGTLNSLAAENEEISRRFDTVKNQIDKEFHTINEMESRLIENQKKLYGMDLDKENQEEQIRIFQDQHAQMLSALHTTHTQETRVKEARATMRTGQKEKEKQWKKFQERLEGIEENIRSSQKNIQSAENYQQDNDKEIHRIEKKILAEEENKEKLQEKLRKLTDVIVEDLDFRLKETGFDHHARRRMEERIETLINETSIRAKGRRKLLEDQITLSEAQGLQGLWEKAGSDFLGLHHSLEELRQCFSDYKNISASFLEDFLSPEGIITQKRDLDEKIAHSNQNRKELKETLVILEKEKASLARRLAESRSSLEEFRVSQARTAAQISGTQDALTSLKRETEAEEMRLQEIQRGISDNKIKIKNLDAQVSAIRRKEKQLESSQRNLKQDMATFKSKISQKNKKVQEEEKKLKDLSAKRHQGDIKQREIHLSAEYLDDEKNLLFQDFRDHHSRELSDFSSLRENIILNPKQLRENLANSKKEIKELGQVNLMAPEEFGEISERYSFLSKQIEDLQKAKNDLNLVTEEIRKESILLFLATYKKIHHNFHAMFRRLFGGGRAEIKLIDPDNPLHSGLEIYAQPPGKNLENISLLSGGERALCGVALLFATYLVKPSPFCILDEIDAALDEANIHRFTDLLSEFGKSSQFIVITHNKKTVTSAHSLLGVTMQESGISRLLTLRLDKQENKNENPLALSR